jgi:hypothetical protein
MESAADIRSPHEKALELLQLQLFLIKKDLQAVIDSQSNGSDYDDLYFGVKDIISKNNFDTDYLGVSN